MNAILQRAMVAHALGGRAPDLVTAVRRAAGIYGAAPTCHGAFAARVPGYSPAALEEAIVARTLLRVAAMRGSIYLVPRELLPHALALGALRTRTLLNQLKIGPDLYRELGERVRRVVAERPRTAAEIKKALGADAHERMQLVLGVMSRDNSLVRTRIRGGVRSQSFEYAWLADWLPLPALPSTHDALVAWAELWLEANGPATIEDFAWWAAIKPKDARPIFDALGTIPRDGLEATAAQWDALADTSPDERVHLLPMWDAWLMAHADRSRYLDPRHAPRVVDRVGNVTNIILHHGRVVGIWDVDTTHYTLLYAPFGKLAKKAVASAAQALAGLWPIDDVRQTTEPMALRDAPLNRFLSPLVGRADASSD